MKRTKSGTIILAAFILSTLFVAGCGMKGSNPIPPAGTSVNTTSEIFRQTAKGLSDHCAQIGGCTCFLDGIQTTCAVVFSCLDAGFCTLVAK